MKWIIQYSNEALDFIEREKISDEIKNEIKKLILKVKRENIKLDI
jgi:hypothetical protein